MYLPQILSPENRIQICLVQKTDLLFLSPENLKSPAWNTGQKNSEKLPQNMFKTSFDNFGNDAGHFCVFEFFLIFRKLSMTPWNTGEKNFFKKKRPKTRLDTWERFWTFWNFETFLIFFFNFF